MSLTLSKAMRCVNQSCWRQGNLTCFLQEENFDEDEGIYDELHLDEEEEKFGLVPDDADSDDSGEASEGRCELSYKILYQQAFRNPAVATDKET
jgi:hypothetical protein